MLTELTDLAADLTAAGIPTTLDPAKVAPPGAWLHAISVEPITLDLDTYTVTADLHLAVRDRGTTTALTDLFALLTRALGVVTPSAAVQTDAYLASPGGNLPAFTIPLKFTVTE